eukprot:6212116-Pleurochrysis_carterae.AAC.3
MPIAAERRGVAWRGSRTPAPPVTALSRPQQSTNGRLRRANHYGAIHPRSSALRVHLRRLDSKTEDRSIQFKAAVA